MYKNYDKSPAPKPAAKPNIEDDPTENVQELFDQLDKKFFQSKMKQNGVILEWNEHASSTAGYCYQLDDAIKKTKRCYIVLNKPLLMLRKREDLVDTLLHEMIHAMLYVQGIHEKNGGHGPNFVRIMRNINRVAGTKITIFHRFRDEVDHCKDLSDLKKREAKKKPTPKPILKPTPVLRPNPNPNVRAAPTPLLKPLLEPIRPMAGANSPFRVGVPSPLQNRRYKAMAEIFKARQAAVDNNAIKLIGYDSDSDSDLTDYDSDNETLYDRKVSEWMNYAKNLRDVRPWVQRISQPR